MLSNYAQIIVYISPGLGCLCTDWSLLCFRTKSGAHVVPQVSLRASEGAHGYQKATIFTQFWVTLEEDSDGKTEETTFSIQKLGQHEGSIHHV